MTRLASYEANEGKKNAAIGSYFRGDYIGWQVLKTAICATIAYLIILAMSVAYDFQVFMLDIYKLDLMEYGRQLLIRYICFVGAFCVITYLVYIYRYNQARKSLRLYYQNLKRLSRMYENKQ